MPVNNNKRIFYASHSVALGDDGVVVQGAQSVSVNTNYNLEQIFQLGRLAVYDQISTDPEVEVTINKVLDGHPTIWGLCGRDNTGFPVGTPFSIVGRANDRVDIVLGVGDETDAVMATQGASITMTGCFVNSLNYTFPVDGNFTEEVSFVGSHKAVGGTSLAPTNANPDTVVRRRQHFNLSSSVLPSELNGKRLSQASISTSFNREKMFRLGEFSPFHRYVNFPIEVTVSFDVIQDGNTGSTLAGQDFNEVHNNCEGRVYQEQPIIINICDETGGGGGTYSFDLGSGCSLQSVSYSGGDTGGGAVTETWTYVTYNDLTITG